MFTERFGLSPYIRHTRFVFEMLNTFTNTFFADYCKKK